MKIEINLYEHEVKTIFWLAGFIDTKEEDYSDAEKIEYALKTALENSKP